MKRAMLAGRPLPTLMPLAPSSTNLARNSETSSPSTSDKENEDPSSQFERKMKEPKPSEVLKKAPGRLTAQSWKQ